MNSLSLSENDLQGHVITFGIDAYPPIELSKNRTKLNTFFEAASSRWGTLFQGLVVSESLFSITTSIARPGLPGGAKATLTTFQVTERGPILRIPLMLPDPFGVTGLVDDPITRFHEVRKLFLAAVPETKIMRVGMVRKLLFGTGDTACQGIISRMAKFDGANLRGGRIELKHRDDLYNVNVKIEPVEITRSEKLAIGTTLTERVGHGLQVELDVNNWEINKFLEDDDILGVLERATRLWPERLLEYLNGRM